MSVTTPVFSAIVVMKSLQRLREKSLPILTFCAYQDEDTRRATQTPTPDMDCNWPRLRFRRPAGNPTSIESGASRRGKGSGGGGRPAVAAITGDRTAEPCSDFGLLRDLQGIIHLDAEVTHGGLQLEVTQKQLHGA